MIENKDPRYSADRLRQEAEAARVQAIDEPSDYNTLPVIRQLKEAVESLGGVRGHIKTNAVRVQDLTTLGLADLLPDGNLQSRLPFGRAGDTTAGILEYCDGVTKDYGNSEGWYWRKSNGDWESFVSAAIGSGYLLIDGSVDSTGVQHFNAGLSIPANSTPLLLGASDDVSLDFDGTDFIIDPSLQSTTPKTKIQSRLYVNNYTVPVGNFDVYNGLKATSTPTSNYTDIVLDINGVVNFSNANSDAVIQKNSVTATNHSSGNTLTGTESWMEAGGSGTLDTIKGGSFTVGTKGGTTAGITTARALELQSKMVSTGTIGTVVHLDVLAPSGTATRATDSTGIKIANLTAGTEARAIWLEGSGAGSDIVFGASKEANIAWDGTDLAFDTGTGDANFSADISVTGNADVTGNVDCAGHMALGADASVTTTEILNIDETLTPAVFATNSGQNFAVDAQLDNFLSTVIGQQFTMNTSGTSSATSQATCIDAAMSHTGSNDIATMAGLKFRIGSGTSSGGSTGQTAAVNISSSFSGTGGTFATVIGLNIANMGQVSKTTDVTALQIAAQQAVTSKRGIWLASDGAGGDIVFGASKDGRVMYEDTSGLVFEETTDNKFRYRVSADTDITLDFEGTTNSGQMQWLEDEDRFKFADTVAIDSDLILPKTSGNGIKVDTTTPTFPWHDIIGSIQLRGTGSDPAWAAYDGSSIIYQAQFTATNKYLWMVYHIPHDYVPGSDLYIHSHWSHNVTTVNGGSVTWEWQVSYASGYDTDTFTTPVAITYASNASTSQYGHVIGETQLSSSGGSGGTLLDSDDIEIDGLILVRVRMSANNITVSGGGVPDPFLHTVDVHYQSTNIGTKDKNTPFYT